MLHADNSSIELDDIGNGDVNTQRIANGKLVGNSGNGKPLLKRLASHSSWDRLEDCVVIRMNTSMS